ncbi:hypothetical protein [Rhizobium sp. RU36D]|uniref:hypothetical protein n=1 Tax=Rhizobium sp. RU36D TaxID=1907415 RepID=UPI0009D7EDCA|nr:hypothetical protein [Rhizobium sp. RU36D]SMD17453.1 hypothetical protein SAMN05880593_13260 [Rhizobium sp. RU36D]
MTTSKPSKGRRASSPFSLRLTAEERAYLETAAGNRALGDYIRGQLLSAVQNNPHPHPHPHPHNDASTERLSPEARQRLLAQMLGMLGQSGILRSLSDLANAARIGVLPLTPDILEEIKAACAAVLEMRITLLRAVGLKPSDEVRHDS